MVEDNLIALYQAIKCLKMHVFINKAIQIRITKPKGSIIIENIYSFKTSLKYLFEISTFNIHKN